MGAISLTQNKEYPAEDVSVQDELRDAGTELLNKKAITNYAKKLIDKRVNHRVTIAIIDIDDFKTISFSFINWHCICRYHPTCLFIFG